MVDEQAPAEPPTTPEPPPASPPPDLAAGVKSAFVQYLADNGLSPDPGKPVDVDLEFLKRHAGPLIVHMLRAATQNLVPKDLTLSLGTTPADAGPTEAPPVRVNFDLGGLLAKILEPPRP